MKRRIISAAIAVLMISSLFACNNTNPAEEKTTLASSSTVQATTAAVNSTTSTTAKIETTTAAVVQTVTETSTTVKSTTTTQAETTSKPTTTAATTTLPTYDENKPEGYYKTIQNAFREDLKYGVFRRRNVINHIETLIDGTEIIVKQDITEYYNRLFYYADFDDLLPAAIENKDTYSDEISLVLDIINGYRKEQNIAPLTLSNELTEIACARAEEIAWSGEHSHRRPNGTMFSTLLKSAGISDGIVGENIGWGYETAESVCIAWRNSESHYDNIMNPEFVKIGIGVAADPDPDGKLCWTQIFMNE
ncbi:MAG: CAP domain-containing protein [Ruminococcaceae bacterium]|nr:CAP domain-containing protein [Oscillospiraceae bacterium]